MCKHFACAVYVIGKVLKYILMKIVRHGVEWIFKKAQIYYIIEIFFLPINYLCICFKHNLLLYVVSGAEIGFSYQRCE